MVCRLFRSRSDGHLILWRPVVAGKLLSRCWSLGVGRHKSLRPEARCGGGLMCDSVLLGGVEIGIGLEKPRPSHAFCG